MTFHYNRESERKKRKELRNNPTNAEKILWKYLKGKQLIGYKFRRQYSVDGFIIDFYCPKTKLAIEIDGGSHFESKTAMEYDLDREHHIKKFGIQFLRFTNNEIYDNVENVVDRISEKLRELDDN